MDQIKRTNELVMDQPGKQAADDEGKASEVRALNDLEMSLCGGGDGIVCW